MKLVDSHTVCAAQAKAPSSTATVLPLEIVRVPLNFRMNESADKFTSVCSYSSHPSRVIHLFWQSLMSEQQFETFYQVGCTQHFPQCIIQLAFHSPPTGLDFHINQRVLSVLNIVELLVS